MAEYLILQYVGHLQQFSELISVLADFMIINAESTDSPEYIVTQNDRAMFKTRTEMAENSVLVPSLNSFNNIFMKLKSTKKASTLKIKHSNALLTKDPLIWHFPETMIGII